MNSWMTSVTGAVTVIFALAGMFIGKLTWEQAGPMIMAGIGLIAAKDFNVLVGPKNNKKEKTT
jgi:hypothetical protein